MKEMLENIARLAIVAALIMAAIWAACLVLALPEIIAGIIL
jgi:hypothetical protein